MRVSLSFQVVDTSRVRAAFETPPARGQAVRGRVGSPGVCHVSKTAIPLHRQGMSAVVAKRLIDGFQLRRVAVAGELHPIDPPLPQFAHGVEFSLAKAVPDTP